MGMRHPLTRSFLPRVKSVTSNDRRFQKIGLGAPSKCRAWFPGCVGDRDASGLKYSKIQYPETTSYQSFCANESLTAHFKFYVFATGAHERTLVLIYSAFRAPLFLASKGSVVASASNEPNDRVFGV